jgi:hypothetical protein
MVFCEGRSMESHLSLIPGVIEPEWDEQVEPEPSRHRGVWSVGWYEPIPYVFDCDNGTYHLGIPSSSADPQIRARCGVRLEHVSDEAAAKIIVASDATPSWCYCLFEVRKPELVEPRRLHHLIAGF